MYTQRHLDAHPTAGTWSVRCTRLHTSLLHVTRPVTKDEFLKRTPSCGSESQLKLCGSETQLKLCGSETQLRLRLWTDLLRRSLPIARPVETDCSLFPGKSELSIYLVFRRCGREDQSHHLNLFSTAIYKVP